MRDTVRATVAERAVDDDAAGAAVVDGLADDDRAGAETSAPARKAAGHAPGREARLERRQHDVLGREPEPRRPRAGGRRRGRRQLGARTSAGGAVVVRVDEAASRTRQTS